MELLSPEAGGLTIGGIALITFIRLVMRIGAIQKSVETFLNNVNRTMAAQREHYVVEEKHQQRVEDRLDRIEQHVRPPRPVSGDHTPVRGVELGAPSG